MRFCIIFMNILNNNRKIKHGRCKVANTRRKPDIIMKRKRLLLCFLAALL